MRINKTTKELVTGIIVIFLFASTRFAPLPEGLTREGLTAIIFLIGAIILWVTEILPIAVSTFLVVTALPFFGVMPLADVFSSFANTVFFFVLATFALTAALVNTDLPERIASLVLRWAGNNSRKLVLGFSIGTAVLSAIMSNVPTCALFASLSITIIKANSNAGPGETNLGRALMICVPAGAVLGGFMTPAGGPTNIVAINLLEETLGIRITFLEWMIVGIPVGIVGVLIAAFVTTAVWKPEPITNEAIEFANKTISNLGAMSAKEKKTIIIIAITFTLWVMSTWFPVLNTTAIALFGMVAFFLPGIRVLDWKKFSDNASWDVLFLIGGVNSLAAAALTTGAATWLVNSALSGAAAWPSFVTILVVSAIGCVLHIIIPSGPAVTGLAVVPMITVATMCGLNPVMITMLTAFWGGVTFMLPTDAVAALTYRYRYYKIGEMVKSGWIVTVVMVVVAAAAIPPLVMLIE